MIKISTSVKILTALIYVPTTLGLSFVLTILTVLGEVGILLKGKDYFKMTGLMQACEKNIYIYTHSHIYVKCLI